VSHPEKGCLERPRALFRVIDETDDYTNAVAGPTVEAVRIGKGVGPNVVLALPGDRLTVTSSSIGMPMVSRSRIADGRIVATFVHRTHGESRWCGVDLEPGTVMVYGSGAEHMAVNRPGLRFTFVITDVDQLCAAAATADVPLDVAPDGSAVEFRPSESTVALGRALDAYGSGVVQADVGPAHADDLLLPFARLLSAGGDCRRIGRGKSIDSRKIVTSCVEVASTSTGLPSIIDMCRAAHVSERRLRAAFIEAFDLPPSQYFRARALDEAHRRLRAADPCGTTVTTIAAGLGFDHLGRFAGRYKQIYGESPSVTLESHRRLAL
jgi:AraC-like DNA-binding protein